MCRCVLARGSEPTTNLRRRFDGGTTEGGGFHEVVMQKMWVTVEFLMEKDTGMMKNENFCLITKHKYTDIYKQEETFF